MKKKNYAQKVQHKRIWATAQLYCEKKKLYCNLGFVLQEEGWLHERVSQYKNCIVIGAAGGLGKKKICIVKKKICIATLQLYCKREGWKKKLYCNCIAREGCSWTNCIASQGIVLQLGVQVGQELYCNTCIVLQLRRA